MMSRTLRSLGELDLETGDYQERRRIWMKRLRQAGPYTIQTRRSRRRWRSWRGWNGPRPLAGSHERAAEALAALESVRLM